MDRSVDPRGSKGGVIRGNTLLRSSSIPLQVPKLCLKGDLRPTTVPSVQNTGVESGRVYKRRRDGLSVSHHSQVGPVARSLDSSGSGVVTQGRDSLILRSFFVGTTTLLSGVGRDGPGRDLLTRGYRIGSGLVWGPTLCTQRTPIPVGSRNPTTDSRVETGGVVQYWGEPDPRYTGTDISHDWRPV